jgi:3-oxoacyl-[acyl-carrier protein] reductase
MILVTGASRGIGLSISQHLSSKGFEVLGVSRSPFNANFQTSQLDVTDFEKSKILANELKAQGTKLKAIINVAGVASMNLMMLTPENVIRKIIDVNLVGTINICQAFSSLLIRNKGGSIINFSSIAVPLNLPGESIYAASKAGVETFSKSIAKELSKHEIRVNCISPGPMDTDLLKGVPKFQIEKIISSQSIQKQFELNSINPIIDFLLSEGSNCITGQIFNIGGI